MARRAPPPLLENRDLAFLGEHVAADIVVDAAEVESVLAARNPHGKPNFDVLRRTLNADGAERWLVDFPADMDEREASLYEAPFALLDERGLVDRGAWRNPHANAELRAALARRPRYLAAPRASREPLFGWADAELLPDDSLVVLARDDDFAHGVFASHWFHAWWRAFFSADPLCAVLSFPLPWPHDELGALTKEQADAKFALARAARSENQTAIDEAADAAYAAAGVRGVDGDVLQALLALHRLRLGEDAGR